MGWHPRSWGVGWGDVDPPPCSKRNAPLDAALLAPFGRRRVLTSDCLLSLVQGGFCRDWGRGEAAPLDEARVEEWVQNAIARGLVEKVADGTLRLTQLGEGRRKALQLAGLPILVKVPGLRRVPALMIAAAGGSAIATSQWLPLILAVVFVVIVGLAVILDNALRLSLRPLKQRQAEVAGLPALKRIALAERNGLKVTDLQPPVSGEDSRGCG